MPAKNSVKMLVSVTDENSFGDWTLRYKAVTVAFHDGKLYSAGGYPTNTPRELEDFQVYASRDDKYPGSKLDAYARYREVYTVDLQRAEDMTKLLRKVDRKVRQLTERYGYATDASQYTAYVAEAIGATEDRPFLRKVDPDKDFDGTGYRAMSASELRSWLQDQERSWEKKHNVATETN